METPVHEMEYKGYRLKFYQDQDAESPRQWDNLGVMFCEHSRYELGDKGAENPFIEDETTGKWKLRDDVVVALPLVLLDHSGLAMRTGSFREDPQGWDSGQVGVIYVTKEQALKESGARRITKRLKDILRKNLENEVKTYDDYLQGNVYGYIVEDKEGNNVSSCWGYYPDHPVRGGLIMFPSWEKENAYMIGEAKFGADSDVKEKSECGKMEAL